MCPHRSRTDMNMRTQLEVNLHSTLCVTVPFNRSRRSQDGTCHRLITSIPPSVCAERPCKSVRLVPGGRSEQAVRLPVLAAAAPLMLCCPIPSPTRFHRPSARTRAACSTRRCHGHGTVTTRHMARGSRLNASTWVDWLATCPPARRPCHLRSRNSPRHYATQPHLASNQYRDPPMGSPRLEQARPPSLRVH